MNLTISRFFKGLWIAGLLGTLTVSAQETATVNQNNVNVRGRAGFNGEVITVLRSGEPVEVLDTVTLSETKSGEPAKWLKIALPANTPVWVHSDFIDPATHAVTANRLSVRGGPGVNYSVLGFADKGTAVSEISRKGSWIEISPTPNLSGYIAASMVTLAPKSATVAAATPADKPTIAASVTAPPAETITDGTIAEATVSDGDVTEMVLLVDETSIPSSEPAKRAVAPPVKHSLPGSTATVVADPAPAIVSSSPMNDRPLSDDERARQSLEDRTRAGQRWYIESDTDDRLLKDLPEIRRRVTREGVIRNTMSIQAPADYSLNSERNGTRLNYLYTTSTNVPLAELLGMRVRINGEEGIDARWPNTPVLLIKTLDVIP
jgi:uncharacterized protein YgiM (DUF1202 family)